MDREQLERCHEALIKLKQELSEEIASLEQSARPVQLDQQAVGRVSRGDAMQQQSMALANLEQCRQRMQEVMHAEQRFSEAEYGYCEHCDSVISLPRLLARPESRFCLSCQSAVERTQ
ncbi:transcriptional regulator, TraR/DksA family [Amphritea atlantica]|jgi:DnaK suppressor protein|uniref:Transcriptional regulator, TraR/DksA family n=1 Tax=Amphritea atlantica TaxID=355243 RepID=A0A1H9DCI2_9GAMM|nr:TraR/DksA family transcriptional regulator [Amphritea atlantica]SEQ10438.1 transcriptional regulator, TraR/DksA family [Amphritea atlantica]